MRILNVKNSPEPNGVVLTALAGSGEFSQLAGHLDRLCVFARDLVDEPATFTKTGARHSYAKYLLLPVKLRREFGTDEFDYTKLKCGSLRYRDTLYVIYEIPRKQGPGGRGESSEDSQSA